MPNVMAALPNIGGVLCSTPQSLADAQYWRAVQHVSDLHLKFALRPHHVCKYGRRPICDG